MLLTLGVFLPGPASAGPETGQKTPPVNPDPHVIIASREIEASPERIWSILMDLEHYPEWNPFTPEVETSFKVGDPIRMSVQMGKKRMVRTETISVNEPRQRLCWDSRVLFAFLLNTRRCQTLEVIDAEHTRYVTRLEFHGLLRPLVLSMYRKDMQEGFVAVAEALQARARATR